MAYKGKYQPSHPRKYKGDPTNITFRSLWEKKFMNWCDKNTNILEWSSEEIIIPYRGPDGKPHRYFPDFYMKQKELDGKIKKYVIEVKPLKQCSPPKRPKRQTKDIFVKHSSMLEIKQSGKKQENGVLIDNGNLK